MRKNVASIVMNAISSLSMLSYGGVSGVMTIGVTAVVLLAVGGVEDEIWLMDDEM